MKKTKRVSIRIEEELIKKIKKESIKRNVNVSIVFRDILKKYYGSNNKNKENKNIVPLNIPKRKAETGIEKATIAVYELYNNRIECHESKEALKKTMKKLFNNIIDKL